MRDYSATQVLLANTPYTVMLLTGALVVGYGLGPSVPAFLGAAAYLVYGVLGALWIMVFICPYCSFYDTRACPCGYGKLSALLAPKGDREAFAEKFRRHIPVIVPLWVIPAICGGIALWRSFSWWLLGVVLVFAVNSFVVLPLLSRRHGCAECAQRSTCPWMRHKLP
jgi:hypothetical protein